MILWNCKNAESLVQSPPYTIWANQDDLVLRALRIRESDADEEDEADDCASIYIDLV